MNASQRTGAVGAFFVLVVMSRLAQATVELPVAFDEMVRASQLVVHGRVVEARSQQTGDRRSIETVVTIAVTDALKGQPGGEVTFRMPGGEVDFQKSDMPQAPTKGRSIDHIGFEVRELEALCKELGAQGLGFDTPFHVDPETKVKTAYILDPMGMRIALTEGLPTRW